jgi:hypothetical protein
MKSIAKYSEEKTNLLTVTSDFDPNLPNAWNSGKRADFET